VQLNNFSKANLIQLCFGLTILFIIVSLSNCDSDQNENKKNTQQSQNNAQYVGANACQSCHEKEHAEWQESHHYHAMEPANDSNVLGNFNNIHFKADGVENRFFKKDNKFFIETKEINGSTQIYEVLYTFGYAPLQQYLVAAPGGRMQPTRASWNTQEKKWFHQYAGQKIQPNDWLHWTGNGQNWNTMCASCHTTNFKKQYHFESDTYKSTYDAVNVNCESCHGPGSNHIENTTQAYGKLSTQQAQLNSCAPCHARKTDLQEQALKTGEILDDLIPQIINDEAYYADGQIKEEDFEYGSFVQSKMYHNGVTCNNCHNSHSGKLLKVGNALCTNCHEAKYDSEAHHMHKASNEGSQCINCHMPQKTYMGIHQRHDHSFRIPRPDQSVIYNTPNTCTQCHSNKTNTWAANEIKKHYGPNRAYHFSDDLLPGSKLNSKSEYHLIKLLQDTSQPEIARATAAFYLTNLPTAAAANALVKSLLDPKSLIRYHALKSLVNFPSGVWINAAEKNLTDKVKAVRIAAADLFHKLPPQAIPASAKTAYLAADAENKQYLKYQCDFSLGNVMLADYELQEGDTKNAILHYLRGLKKDSLMNYARLNLSAAYNTEGKNTEALQTLKMAAAIDPKNDRIFYNLGLLNYEIKDLKEAENNFEKAVNLGSNNPSVYYNYGLLLQQQNKQNKAEQILLKGYRWNQNDVTLNYALSYFYLQENNRKKAIYHAQKLKQMQPNNTEFAGLFRTLGI
jgi:tetratricopeptide (TPR) repeat protein